MNITKVKIDIFVAIFLLWSFFTLVSYVYFFARGFSGHPEFQWYDYLMFIPFPIIAAGFFLKLSLLFNTTILILLNNVVFSILAVRLFSNKIQQLKKYKPYLFTAFVIIFILITMLLSTPLFL